ncbi:Zinc-binding alcohol dehydrogenase domain-containing protein 2 [Anopheles sinensis]|uniref:Zinc-binding alcohol dehydrogenase domain-containing protein 2 n=1 Tax=Anopheles sinensis TaxID=74873 RepID=A0A084WIB6_ANOSI|nr:Zinc-binding alcohol dehydrogenase domain-containing protein 2 [Anopheles sinensis]
MVRHARGDSSIELNSVQSRELQPAIQRAASRGPNRYRGGESSSTYRRHFHVVVRPSPLPSALCEQEESE